MQYLKDRVVVVTGASNGFGRLIADKCAAGGAKVVALDIDQDGLADLVRGITVRGDVATHHVTDVTDLDQMKEAAKHAIDTFGAIDVMVNNAGVMPLAYFADHERAVTRWHKAVDINIKGVINGICAVYDQMISQGRGQIVNISSIYGNGGIAGSAVYSATKAAVNVLADALRVETSGKIKVSTVRPTGVFGTNLHTEVVDRKAVVSLTGQNAASFEGRVKSLLKDELPAALTDPDSTQYWLITPDDLSDAVVHVIDQPWGVNISDVTVRATGEDYIF